MSPPHQRASGANRRVLGATLEALMLLWVLISCHGKAFAGSNPAGTPGAALPVPVAKLTEVRVPGTTAMSAAAVDLALAGYTEREYYADGKANRLRGAVSGSLQTAQLIDGNWPYRNRILVRTPSKRHGCAPLSSRRFEAKNGSTEQRPGCCEALAECRRRDSNPDTRIMIPA